MRNEIKVLQKIKTRVGRHPGICETYEVYENDYLVHIVMVRAAVENIFQHVPLTHESSHGSYTQVNFTSLTFSPPLIMNILPHLSALFVSSNVI